MTEPIEHVPTYGRAPLGRRTWGRGGGTFYGTTVRCSCRTFRVQVNRAPSKGGQKWAEEIFAAHLAHPCEATRYADGPCQEPARFRVVYRSQDGTVLDSHPACFRHGMAEVDRHHASAGIARCDLEEGPA